MILAKAQWPHAFRPTLFSFSKTPIYHFSCSTNSELTVTGDSITVHLASSKTFSCSSHVTRLPHMLGGRRFRGKQWFGREMTWEQYLSYWWHCCLYEVAIFAMGVFQTVAAGGPEIRLWPVFHKMQRKLCFLSWRLHSLFFSLLLLLSTHFKSASLSFFPSACLFLHWALL